MGDADRLPASGSDAPRRTISGSPSFSLLGLLESEIGESSSLFVNTYLLTLG